ncbi:hypothetical protein JOB18_007955 [Solea senegalensis]|uniref:Uncharacterized protein n=1 Tax=Solea senegalensis TaxID=28829 RepID=A0AAV6Q611_SOLSE|nr:hypothetical protein JOB18_007955 [Solea senegalensis]
MAAKEAAAFIKEGATKTSSAEITTASIQLSMSFEKMLTHRTLDHTGVCSSTCDHYFHGNRELHQLQIEILLGHLMNWRHAEDHHCPAKAQLKWKQWHWRAAAASDVVITYTTDLVIILPQHKCALANFS